MMICCGNRLPAVKSESIKMLNRHVKRLQTKATMLDKKRVRISAGTRMSAVFQYFCRMSP
jgi:hypothetical protein